MYDELMEEQKSFTATLSELYAMLGWVCETLDQTGLSDVEVRRIEIALEEGLVNVISCVSRERGDSCNFHPV